MLRIVGPGIVGLIVLGLWLYCIFDVIASEESLVRNLPKTLWLVLVIFVPTVGSIAWLALGRPLYAGPLPGDTRSRPVKRVWAPEDDPGFSARAAPPPPDEQQRLRSWEADLRRREEKLKRGDTGDDDPKSGGEYPFSW